MLDSVLRILAFVGSSPNGVVSAEALRAFIGEDADRRIRSLLDDGLIEAAGYRYARGGLGLVRRSYRLTARGADALSLRQQQLDQQRQEESEKRRQQEEERAYAAANDRKKRRHDYFVAAFQALLAFILGLLLEYRFQVVGFLVGLFKK